VKTTRWILVVVAVLVLGAAIGWMGHGVCHALLGNTPRSDEPLVEGIIGWASWETAGGKMDGISRMDSRRFTLPGGGSGRSDVDAYGKLYPGFLVIAYPQTKDLGPEVIPTHRLFSVQFGDRGIKTVPPL
jgi:hypothetical protein